VILVLTSLTDLDAVTGCEHLRAAGLEPRVVTCHDLAQPGWRFTLDDNPTLVIGGDKVPGLAVRGVITRLSWVTRFELDFVDEQDRDYAAAEMQAFLLALLTRLTCPVLNRPTPGCLSGPSWSPERWTACAAATGCAVEPIVHRTYAGGALVETRPPVPFRSIHVVGDRSFGDGPDANHAAARAIAKAAGTELLRVAFAERRSEPVFCHADTWIDLADPAVAGAVAKRIKP
jgi:hypothetical protein